jgi:transcription elongation factor Elf1
MKTKLLPCPFCGSNDIKEDNDTGVEDDYFISWIACANCGAKATSEEKWNKRAEVRENEN